MSLKLNSSGGGSVTLQEPSTASNVTLTLPATTGTVQVSGAGISGTTGTFTGLLDISAATAGQIQFPATQNASANANTLDDYEEGTWTPTVNLLGTITYVARNATYVKIGKRVYLTVYMQFSSTNTTQDSTLISFDGLPFTASNVTGTSYEAGATAILSERFYGSSGTAATQFFIGVNGGSTSLRMFQGNYNANIANASWFANANRDSYKGGNTYMLFQFCYDASA